MNAFVEVHDLHRRFSTPRSLADRLLGRPARAIRAVNGASFSIERGTTFALVGESGCGKSTIARMLCGLYPPNAGRIVFDGTDLTALPGEAARQPFRRRIQMIFQDPYASLNPRWRVEDIIAEPLRTHGLVTNRAALRARVAELLEQVGLATSDARRFPHQFSGGQRQRISIARALSSRPEFLICDEPTSALDVSVQAQVLNLMLDLQRNLGLTYLLISHNLAVVSQVADQVGVMYAGRLVETASAARLFAEPRHPYTRMLIEAAPDLTIRDSHPTPIQGDVPDPRNPPPGCTFNPRCPLATDRCRREMPALRAGDGRALACHLAH